MFQGTNQSYSSVVRWSPCGLLVTSSKLAISTSEILPNNFLFVAAYK